MFYYIISTLNHTLNNFIHEANYYELYLKNHAFLTFPTITQNNTKNI